ncbi:MAG: AMP-binding protein, partial [Burkholderiaceae bacterium]
MLEGCVPWPEDLAARYRASGLWLGLTIFEMVERTAVRTPDKVAVVCGERRVTYAELVLSAARLATAFHAQGLRALDRVVVQLPNGLDFVFIYLTLTRIGAIPVMALRAHRHAEVEHFINASGAVAYVVADIVGNFDYRDMAAEMQAKFPALRSVIVAGEPRARQIALRALLDASASASASAAPGTSAAPIPRPNPGDVATMLL